jgi:tetratricopeptide (TPR) repeat protein
MTRETKRNALFRLAKSCFGREKQEGRSSSTNVETRTIVTLPQNAVPLSPPIRAARPRRRSRLWLVLLGLVVLAAGGWFGGRYAWASYHFRAADRAMERYEFDEALEEYERCLRVWPNSIPTRLQAARAARRGGRLDVASKHLDVCEQAGVTPQSALEGELLFAQKGRLNNAPALMNLVREGHPDTVLILEALVKGLVMTDRLDPAADLANQLLEKAPDSAEGHFWLGSVSELKGHLGNAVAHYRRAVDLAPGRTLYRVGLADALAQYGQPAEAWPMLEELLGQSPDNPIVLLGAARCLRALGQSKSALEHLDTLLQAHPDHAEAWAERGRASKDRGNGGEALRCFRKAFDLEPRNTKLGHPLLTELRAQRKVEEAAALEVRLQELEREEKGRREQPAGGKK